MGKDHIFSVQEQKPPLKSISRQIFPMQLDGVLLLLHFIVFLNKTVLFVSSSPMHHQQQLYKFLNETFLLLGRPSSFMFPFVCPL